MPDRLREPAGNAFQVREHPITPLLVQAVQGVIEKGVVIHGIASPRGGVFQLVAGRSGHVQRSRRAGYSDGLFLEAFNSVCRGMSGPQTMQSGFDFRQFALIFRRSAEFSRLFAGTAPVPKRSLRDETMEIEMGRGLLLWLIGIPLPIILVVWLLGGLS